jgi:linoleoyl-CoA desaturase
VSSARSLAQLRTEFTRRGWKRAPTARILSELAVHVALLAGGCVLFLCAAPMWLRAAGVLLSAAGSVGITTNTHTSSHFATNSRRWLNELLTYFGYSLCLGFSATYWWSDHIAGHHVSPNVVGKDNDFEFFPIFALTESEVSSTKGMRRTYHEKWQWIALLFAIPFMGFNLQRNGLAHILGVLRRPAGAKKQKTASAITIEKKRCMLDLAAILVHVLIFLVIPAALFGVGAAVALYALRIGLTSVVMFGILAPAHFAIETPFLTPAQAAGLDHCELQSFTTIDFEGGPLLRWLASGLEYQIEHHLFPEISHTYYPRMSPLVKEFCEARGLPYRVYGFRRALHESILAFRTPKRIGIGAISLG